MAYDAAQALQGFYGIKDDVSLDPAAGLVPLTSSLIPPLVAQAFGLPTLGGVAPPPPPQPLPPPHHSQSLYGSLPHPALMGAFGYGGPQYAAAIQQHSQLAGLPLGYLQALAAASQHQQQQQQQQQQQSAAAFLAQTMHAHSAALAAAARATPASSSAVSQSFLPALSADACSGRGAPSEPATTSVATNSSGLKAPQPSTSNSAGSAQLPHPLMHSLYAALAQQQASYGTNPAATSYAAGISPYAASQLHPAYYARPPDTSAAAAAAAAAGPYGYQQLPGAGPYANAFHPGYGAPALDYAALAAAYRPVAAPSLGAPSSKPQQSASFGEEDYDDGSTRAIKRPRLVWTPQLHKKFESAVQRLGVEKAVPKTIMQEMNIDGLTRENVASHLQKYRMLRRKDTATCSSEGLDSETRTIGSKRSEPDCLRPSAPAATTAPANAAGSGGNSGSGNGNSSGGGGGGGGTAGPPPAAYGAVAVAIKA